MAIVEKWGLLSSDEAFKMIAPVLIELVDETQLDPRINENVAEKLGFVDWEVKNKDGYFMAKLGLQGAPIVWEFDAFKLNERKYGWTVSYGVVRTHIGTGMSSKTKKWFDRIGQMEGIPDALVEDLKSSMNDLEDQASEIAITQNMYITKTLADGFTLHDTFWPWSSTYDGKQLFSKEHLTIGTGQTYSNIVDDGSGNHAPLTFDSLYKAIDMLRGMTDGNGIRMRRPTSWVYDLVVSPELEKKALEILSDGNTFMPYTYTGAEAQNDNFANVFATRDGFKVRLVVLETLNQVDALDPTKKVGSETMWFLINKEGARMRKAFRNLKFGDLSIRIFEDNDTRAIFMTAEKFFGAQILYPEVIVGSKWDSTTIEA